MSAESFDRSRLFSRADARRAGLPLKSLLSSQFTKVMYDQYVATGVPIDLALRARAALRVSAEGARVSHHTAVDLWGAVAPPTSAVHVAQPDALQRSVRQGVKAHYRCGPAQTSHRGLPMSTPEQAFLELASVGTNLVDLVIAGDSLVKAGVTTPAALLQAATEHKARGNRLALRAARLVRTGVDSPMETRLRLLLVLAELPEPTVNHLIRDATGRVVRRLDLSYPEWRLIVEYDGRQHAEDQRQWQSDIQRREELEQGQWRLLVVLAGGVYLHPEQTLIRVRDALLERGATGVPDRFAPEWRRHFG